VYVCMYVCMYVCTYACIYTHALRGYALRITYDVLYVCMYACIYTHALRGYALRITYDVLNFRIVVKRICYLHAVKQHGLRGAQTRARLVLIDD
jgi:hypothetical protein